MADERRREAAARRYNLVTVPTIRVLGLNGIAVAVVLHHWLIGPAVSHSVIVAFVLALELYGFASWILLLSLRSRLRGLADVQFALLVLDMLVCVAATYVTGAERSWLFFLIALRLSDTSIGTTRALALAHLAPLLYLSMMWYASVAAGRAVPFGLAAVNAYTVYGTSLYFVLIGRTASALRARVVSAARVSRNLVAQLQEQTERLSTAMDQATVASRAKSRFLGTVSHELRTPLTNIIAHAELVIDEAERGKDGRMVTDLAHILDSARELSGVIDNLLEVSVIEEEEASVRVELFDVDELVAEITAKVQPIIDRSGNTFEIVNDAPRGLVRTDRMRLRRILLILLGNAAKFTSDGVVTLRVDRGDAGGRAFVRFSVADTGIGIPDHLRAALFTPFMQADASTTRKYGGAGLGLVIAKRYSELIYADLSCEAASGAGTTFTLVVPTGTGDDIVMLPLQATRSGAVLPA